MKFINRIFVGKYLAVLCLEEMKPVCNDTGLYKAVFNHHQHNYLLAFYQIKYRATCFDQNFVVFIT